MLKFNYSQKKRYSVVQLPEINLTRVILENLLHNETTANYDVLL